VFIVDIDTVVTVERMRLARKINELYDLKVTHPSASQC
jgi:hypothetical protein